MQIKLKVRVQHFGQKLCERGIANLIIKFVLGNPWSSLSSMVKSGVCVKLCIVTPKKYIVIIIVKRL